LPDCVDADAIVDRSQNSVFSFESGCECRDTDVNGFGSPESTLTAISIVKSGCDRSRICSASVVPVLNGRCSSISVRITP
jgi:hypothetical protein